MNSSSNMILLAIASFVFSIIFEDPMIGAQSTEIHEHPWLVSVQSDNFHICEGSIVSWNIILTAAHCIIGHPFETLSVRAGSSRVDFGGSIHRATKVQLHAEFQKNISFANDLALIKVSPPVMFGTNVIIVRMVSKRAVDYSGDVAKVAGWELTLRNDSFFYVLRDTDLFIFNHTKCEHAYMNSSANLSKQICTESLTEDSCCDISGGPLVINSVLVGVVSGGFNCPRTSKPEVHASIALYRDWIDENMYRLSLPNIPDKYTTH